MSINLVAVLRPAKQWTLL